MQKPVATFQVTRGGVRVRVRVLPSIHDVHRAYGDGAKALSRQGKTAHAFFQGYIGKAQSIGTITLGLDGDLAEHIPHEVTHAVMEKLQTVTAATDEPLATLVGQLTRTIRAKLRERGIES